MPAMGAEVPALQPALVERLDALKDRYGYQDSSISNMWTGAGTAGDKANQGQVNMAWQGLVWNELDQLYQYNGYARRYVDLIPAEACRKGWHLKDASKDADPLARDARRLFLIARAQEAMTWARLHGGSVVVMITDDVKRPEDLRKPLDLSKVKKLLNLVVCSRYEASPQAWTGDIASINFREVEEWLITPLMGGITSQSYPENNQASISRVIHYTRLAYFAGNRLPPAFRYRNNGFDASVLQAVWEAIRNITVVDQAGAAISHEFTVGVLQINGLASKLTSDQQKDFRDRLTLMTRIRSIWNQMVIDKEDKYTRETVSMAGWSDLHASVRAALAAQTGIPEQVLFGQAPSGLNTDGESHKALMANLISGTQQHRLVPPLTRIYEVLYWARANSGGVAVPDEWTIEFPAYAEMTEMERAKLRLTDAQADALAIQEGEITAQHAALSHYTPTGYVSAILPVTPADIPPVAALPDAGQLGAIPNPAVRPSFPSTVEPFSGGKGVAKKL